MYLAPCGKVFDTLDSKWEHIRSCVQCYKALKAMSARKKARRER